MRAEPVVPPQLSHRKKYAPAGILFFLVVSSLCGCQTNSFIGVILPGERREGVLRESNRIRSEVPMGREARWSFEGSKGQRMVINARSFEFDVFLLLVDPQGSRVAQGDNNAGFFNARINTLLELDGRYTILVCGANEDQFGAYSVTLEDGDREVDWSRAAAESFYDEGVEWGRRAGSARAISWMNLGLGQYFSKRRLWEEADRHYVQSRSEAERHGLAYCQWAVAIERGRLFARRRLFEQAVSELQEALRLSKTLAARAEAEPLVLIEFGDLYYSTARPDLARVYIRSATKQAEDRGSPTTLAVLYMALNDLLQTEERDKAIEYAQMAYDLREGLDPVLDLKTTYRLAGSYLFLQPNKTLEGMTLATAVRDTARRLECADEEAAALALMSMAQYAAGDFDAMIQSARNSLAMTMPQDGNPNPRRVALQLLADGETARGSHQAALDWCHKALETVESKWAIETIEELRRELLSQSRAVCTQIIRNLYALNARSPRTEYAREAFDYAERSRTRSLLNQLFKTELREGIMIDPKILHRDRELLERLSAVRGQLVLLRTSPNVSYDALYRCMEQRAELIAERIKLQAEVANSVGSGYRAAHLSPVAAEQAQSLLSEHYPNSVVLYYQLGVQESFLIVVSRSDFYLVKLPQWAAISKAVAEWRRRILEKQNQLHFDGENDFDYNLIGYQLYKLLIEPAAHLIQGRDLIIVPSGPLGGLAFEALVVRDPKLSARKARAKYLIEQQAVSYAPSMSVLAEVQNKRKDATPGKRVLLLGDTEGTEPADTAAFRDPASGTSLPAARREVLAIAKLAKGKDIDPSVWLGSDANEGRFKGENLSDYRIIHIATHSVSDSQDGESSAIRLSAGSDGTHDGVLTSAEIEDLRLNSDLVVLSGCETSIGQEAGAEGVVGLSRAFLIAGASSICGSLWSVQDSVTENLMTALYQRLLTANLSKSQALRSAKLSLLKLGASPSQWAPFILIGASS